MELEQPADSSDSFQEWLKCQFDDPNPLTDTGVDGQAAARLYREQLQGVPADARQHWMAKNGGSLQSDSVPGHVMQPQCADSELQPCSTASAPTAAAHSVPKSSSVDHAAGSAARTQLQGGDQQEPLPQSQPQRQKQQQQAQPRQAPERKDTTQRRGPGGHGRRTMVGTWQSPAVQFHTLCPSPWPLTQQCSAPPALPGSHALTQPWVHSHPLSCAISSMQQHIWWATQHHNRVMSAFVWCGGFMISISIACGHVTTHHMSAAPSPSFKFEHHWTLHDNTIHHTLQVAELEAEVMAKTQHLARLQKEHADLLTKHRMLETAVTASEETLDIIRLVDGLSLTHSAERGKGSTGSSSHGSDPALDQLPAGDAAGAPSAAGGAAGPSTPTATGSAAAAAAGNGACAEAGQDTSVLTPADQQQRALQAAGLVSDWATSLQVYKDFVGKVALLLHRADVEQEREWSAGLLACRTIRSHFSHCG